MPHLWVSMSEDREPPPRPADSNSVQETYDSYAPIYNDFNHQNDYEKWLGTVLLPELEKHGVQKGTVLDVACGTGRAFGPMLRRNWRVVGCDVSARMLAIAAEEAGGRVELSLADMRHLPRFGEFQLVMCLNDAVNCLLADGELEQSLVGMRRNLADGGLLVFDANCRSALDVYVAGADMTVESDKGKWTWTGLGDVDSGERGILAARVEGDGIEPFLYRERYYSPAETEQAMRRAGLQPVAVMGMAEKDGRVRLREAIDEDRDYKYVCIARAGVGASSP